MTQTYRLKVKDKPTNKETKFTHIFIASTLII